MSSSKLRSSLLALGAFGLGALLTALAFQGGLLPSGSVEAADGAAGAEDRTAAGEDGGRSDAARAEEASGEPSSGRWREAAAPRGPGGDDQGQEEADLAALGYAGGYEKARGASGVVFHAADRTLPGLNLVNAGHAPEASLLDMDGNLLHRWRVGLKHVLSQQEFEEVQRVWHEKHTYWRRVHAFDDGGLLALFADVAMIKVDRDSKIVWTFRGGVHHDLDVSPEGEIYVLTRKEHVVPSINAEATSIEDFVTVVSPDGEELRSVSILSAFARSVYASALQFLPARGDLMHTNTIEVLDGSLARENPAFRKGNVLVSLCKTSMIAVIDLDAERVVWALSGMWTKQHQPTMLADGTMLIFDNKGHDNGWSKVIQFDPLTQQVTWGYYGDEENGFSSLTCGSNQRLANGDTLITESDTGRAFEVDANGQIVWEYFTPHRAGKQKELVATLFEVTRLPADYGEDWLER